VRGRVHHELVVAHVVGFGHDVRHDWVVFRQEGFVIYFFPLKLLCQLRRWFFLDFSILLLDLLWDGFTFCHCLPCLGTVRYPDSWEAEVLQMHAPYEIQRAMLGLLVNHVRVVLVAKLVHLQNHRVRVVMSNQEAILLALEPAPGDRENACPVSW
jgi:hypothetical protein